MKFLLRQVWSCLIEQVILVAFKKRSFQIRRVKCFWTQKSWSGFPVQMKTMQRVSPKLSGHTVVMSASVVILHLRDQNLQCFPRNRRSACEIGSGTSPGNPVSCVSHFLQISSRLRWSELGDLVLKILSVHHITDMNLLPWRSLRPSQAPLAHNLWRMLCAGFRHSADFHARVVLDGAACRLDVLGEADDVLGVLGVNRVVPIAVRVLVSWLQE